MNQRPRIGMILFYVILGVFLLVALRGLYPTETTVEVPYSKFVDDKSDIIDIVIHDDGKVVYTTGDDPRRAIETRISPQTVASESFQQEVERFVSRGVVVRFEKGADSSIWINILGTLIPLGIIIFIWLFAMRALSGRNSQAFTFTRSPAKKYIQMDKKITFKDVAGVDEAIQELGDVVAFLKDPTTFAETGARMPRGLILVGPPGTGKTLLARAAAGEADVPFLYISGSDFVELFVGVGASRVRDLFNQAKSSAPSIVFIDEIDAVGRHRGAGLGGGHDEREQTLNQILVEMDGFDNKTNVIVVAATNRPDILDHALLRPGRFDKKITVDPPDVKGRAEILKIHMRGKPIDPEVDINLLARRTTGFVGADLENLVNEAALLSARARKKLISMIELEEAIDRVMAGPARKSRVMNPKEKKIVAYHEVGHAAVGLSLKEAYPVHKVTIVPRGHSALGFTESLPLEDKYLVSRNELFDNLAQILGGRAAEEIVFSDITTGATNDLERASSLARSMICQYGMSESLGPVSWGREEGEVFLGREITRRRNFSEQIASEIDNEVKKTVYEAYDKAKSIISSLRPALDKAVDYLLEKETITGKELAEILDLVEGGNYYRDDLDEQNNKEDKKIPVIDSGKEEKEEPDETE